MMILMIMLIVRLSTTDLFDDKKLAEMVRQREQNAVTSSTSHAASSVNHIKQSMMLKLDRFTALKTDQMLPSKNVVVKKVELADSVEKARAEAERKRREESNRKRLDDLQRKYMM